MVMKKKKMLMFGSIGLVLLLVISISYAYWSLTFTQNENNVVTTDCFEIEFLEGEKINLTKTYPMSDTDGLQTTPYHFKINNVCDSSASFQINLETLSDEMKKLPDKYLKINLQENEISKITTKLDKDLNPKLTTDPTIEEALESYKLLKGTLNPQEEKEFDVRIWMHSDVTANDKDSMNATYNGKITIISSYSLPTFETIIKTNTVTSGTGIYKVTHEDANITYTNDPVAIQNLKQTEYRYAGSNPNNYINFNNELWRVIGLVNTPEGQRIKLIRNENIGSRLWFNSPQNVNGSFGINEWSQSEIKNYLNQDYYNNLSLDAKNQIDEVTWNTGSSHESSYYNTTTKSAYDMERNNMIGKVCNPSSQYCNDTIPRTTSWKGQVGLMYPSDYGYATIGGSNHDREACLNATLGSYSAFSNCKHNNWLIKEEAIWLMNPMREDKAAIYVLVRSKAAGLGRAQAGRDPLIVYPVVYLKQEVKIESGTGSANDPLNIILED